ncbi:MULTISPECIES: hypothetical protein [unclassified Caballeronia]|nr:MULTISPECIES: hypothetical protein [unclassified Caballeronia]MDR5817757.1 hypothetical protein [Caballeronia sp. LZ033]MDR5882593.1 hypothetical protein [Caballeronia sp. LZ032]
MKNDQQQAQEAEGLRAALRFTDGHRPPRLQERRFRLPEARAVTSPYPR